MNPVAGAKKIAAPDPLQTHKEIAIFSRIDPSQFIRESDWPLFLIRIIRPDAILPPANLLVAKRVAS